MKDNYINLSHEIQRHSLGLAQFRLSNRPITKCALNLSVKLANLAKENEASYWEIQEALVLADSRLYDELTSQNN